MYGITTLVSEYLSSLGYMPTIFPVCVAPLLSLSWFIVRKKNASIENFMYSFLSTKPKSIVFILQFVHVIYLAGSAVFLLSYPKIALGKIGNTFVFVIFFILCTASLVISMVSQSIIKKKPLD